MKDEGPTEDVIDKLHQPSIEDIDDEFVETTDRIKKQRQDFFDIIKDPNLCDSEEKL